MHGSSRRGPAVHDLRIHLERKSHAPRKEEGVKYKLL